MIFNINKILQKSYGIWGFLIINSCNKQVVIRIPSERSYADYLTHSCLHELNAKHTESIWAVINATLNSAVVHHHAVSKHIPNSSVMCWKRVRDWGRSYSEVTDGERQQGLGDIWQSNKTPNLVWVIEQGILCLSRPVTLCLWQLITTNPPLRFGTEPKKVKEGGKRGITQKWS